MQPALLIIDVQTALCTGAEAALGSEQLLARINHLARRARAAGVPVVLVQHEELDGSLVPDSAGWQLDARLTVAPTDLRVRKQASDAFHRTELEAQLRSRGVDQLVVCGLQSDFCIDSTVRRALALGFPVTLVADAHSTVANGVLTAAQITAHHNATLAHLGSYGVRATPVPAAEVRFGAAAGPEAAPVTFATSREISRSPAQVFAAFADPARLARWWGPAGFTNTFTECEFKPGGRWVYTMHAPNGGKHPNESVFAEIEPAVRVVIQHISAPCYRLTIGLAPSASGTTVAWEQVFEHAAFAERVRHIVVPANEQNLDRLTAEVLSPPQVA